MTELSFDASVSYGLAFSGGCDSSYLLAAMLVGGADVKAYLVKTAFQAQSEIDDAKRLAESLGADLEIIEAGVLAHEEICANPPDRCYWCKRFIFGRILDHMARDGRTVLVDGTNASDDPARRPGFRALYELGVRSPLREAGISKESVRVRSRDLGLFTADKPSFSCYAVHVPEGARINQQRLDEAAARLEQTKMNADKPDADKIRVDKPNDDKPSIGTAGAGKPNTAEASAPGADKK